MVVSQTPLRIEFTGGSDLPAFCRHEPGAIVNITINKYIYIMTKNLASHAKNLDQIQDPLIRHTLSFLKIKNLNFASLADLPSGTGLGSSGSFLVGLLNAIYALNGQKTTPEKLAQQANHIEMNLAKVKCGAQDHYAAAFGGLRYHRFNPDGTVETKVIKCSPQTKQRFQKRLLLFFTGTRRSSTNLLDNLWSILEKNSKVRQLMSRRVELSNLIAQKLSRNSLSSFGEILDEEWALKKAIAPIETNSQIDSLYQKAKKNGAQGGKLIGAGGGGFLLFYAPEDKHEAIKKALSPLKPTIFKFASRGSRIIYSS